MSSLALLVSPNPLFWFLTLSSVCLCLLLLLVLGCFVCMFCLYDSIRPFGCDVMLFLYYNIAYHTISYDILSTCKHANREFIFCLLLLISFPLQHGFNFSFLSKNTGRQCGSPLYIMGIISDLRLMDKKYFIFDFKLTFFFTKLFSVERR